MSQNVETIRTLMQDEAFVEAMLQADSAEAVQKMLADKGVTMSVEEIENCGELLQKMANGELTPEQIEKAANGELSEEELAQAAGGSTTGEKIIMGVSIVGTIALTGVAYYFLGKRNGVLDHKDAIAESAYKVAETLTRW